MIKFFKYIILILFSYNVISLYILFYVPENIKLKLWKYIPYDYENIINYPMNYNKLSLLNISNIKNINFSLNQNLNKNSLNVDYWNYKLSIEKLMKNKNHSLQKSFINLFILTKNNKNKNFELKKYFLLRNEYFSEKNKNILLNNY